MSLVFVATRACVFGFYYHKHVFVKKPSCVNSEKANMLFSKTFTFLHISQNDAILREESLYKKHISFECSYIIIMILGSVLLQEKYI